VGLLLVASAGLAAVLASPVVQLAYGPAFAESAAQLMLLLPGVVFLGMLVVVSQYIAAVGIPTSLVWAWGAGLLTVIVLCAWLVPFAGASGAAIALSVTYFVLLLMASAIGFAHRGASR
jgi:O-antigen/teichoic acid export membrane protein